MSECPPIPESSPTMTDRAGLMKLICITWQFRPARNETLDTEAAHEYLLVDPSTVSDFDIGCVEEVVDPICTWEPIRISFRERWS